MSVRDTFSHVFLFPLKVDSGIFTYHDTLGLPTFKSTPAFHGRTQGHYHMSCVLLHSQL